jgi:hypothetical protein
MERFVLALLCLSAAACLVDSQTEYPDCPEDLIENRLKYHRDSFLNQALLTLQRCRFDIGILYPLLVPPGTYLVTEIHICTDGLVPKKVLEKYLCDVPEAVVFGPTEEVEASGTPPDVEVSPVDGTPPDVEVSPVDGTPPEVEVSPVDGTPPDVEVSPVDGTPPEVEVSPVDGTSPEPDTETPPVTTRPTRPPTTAASTRPPATAAPTQSGGVPFCPTSGTFSRSNYIYSSLPLIERIPCSQRIRVYG